MRALNTVALLAIVALLALYVVPRTDMFHVASTDSMEECGNSGCRSTPHEQAVYNVCMDTAMTQYPDEPSVTWRNIADLCTALVLANE